MSGGRVNFAAKVKMKKISKIYSLSYVLRKNTLSHEVLAHSIAPDGLFTRWHGEYKRNDLSHRNEFFVSCNKFTRMEVDYFKGAKLHKKRACGQVTMLVINGSICEKCLEFESNKTKHNIDATWWDRIRDASNRDQIAALIRDARKNAVNLSIYICAKCTKEDDDTKKSKEIDHIQAEEEIKKEDDQKELKRKIKWLYLMKCYSTGFYKIGVSCDPKLRERTLQSEKPTVKMVAKWDDAQEWESHWHDHFSKHRMRGEWFQLTKCQVAFIVSTMSGKTSNNRINYIFNNETRRKRQASISARHKAIP